jgi:hypothetical protein
MHWLAKALLIALIPAIISSAVFVGILTWLVVPSIVFLCTIAVVSASGMTRLPKVTSLGAASEQGKTALTYSFAPSGSKK